MKAESHGGIGRTALLLAAAALLCSTTNGQVACSRTYTLDADFDEGILINLNHDTPDQLQLNEIAEPLPFIWIACSDRGTVVRIDTATGAILGEYLSAPQGYGLNPSRTTVDLLGNVWVGNRNEGGGINGVPHGSVVKIGLVIGGIRGDKNADGTVSPNPAGGYLAPPFLYSTAVDRDGDGLIRTSAGLGDVLSWVAVTDGVGDPFGDARVEDAGDECILVYQRLPDADGVRHVSVDGSNNVWVGGYPYVQRMFHKLAATTGAILASFDARPYGAGGYGGLIDANGVLWSASISQNALLRYDLNTGIGITLPISGSYGLGIDSAGNIWNSMWSNNAIMKIAPDGTLFAGFPKATGGASNDRGVAVTPDDDVWVAGSGGSDVSRLAGDGSLRKVIPLGPDGITPTGVAVDANGKVWVTCYDSDTAKRIDPDAGGDGLGAVDLTVSLGANAGPYNYSDMTGGVLIGVVQQGRWNVVYDSLVPDTPWGAVSWNAEVPGDASISALARAANSEAALPASAWVPVDNGVSFCDLAVTGRYLEVQVQFGRGTGPNGSPILYDLTVDCCNEPPDCSEAIASIALLWPPNHTMIPIGILGVTDPDGDPVVISIDAIWQDEPVDTTADGAFVPDGDGIGSGTAWVRAERTGSGNGRVYHIAFTAVDGNGGFCEGAVRVGVPKSMGNKGGPVDDGLLYDSTAVAP